MSDEKKQDIENKLITVKEFFEKIPQGQVMDVNYVAVTKYADNTCSIVLPELQLYCETCDGIRFFESEEERMYLRKNDIGVNKFVEYRCKNCEKTAKIYSLIAIIHKDGNTGTMFKYGELPTFGQPTPSRVANLIKEEKELFTLGKRCESKGMGIGAFVYYRRVIESQKNRILDELMRAIIKNNPDDEILIKEIENAKKETRFTEAIKSIKHALPKSLFINGYNPLTLLHKALSEGVHEHTDKECLELASDIKFVLFEFVERLSQVLKEDDELNKAVNRLANKKR